MPAGKTGKSDERPCQARAYGHPWPRLFRVGRSGVIRAAPYPRRSTCSPCNRDDQAKLTLTGNKPDTGTGAPLSAGY